MSWKFTEALEDGRSFVVTDALLNKTAANNELSVGAGTARDGAETSSRPAYIKIENYDLPDWRPLTARSEVPFTLKLKTGGNFAQTETRIVYFINCYINKNFLFLFRSQMRELAATGLLHETAAVLYIVSSGTEQDRAALVDEAHSIFAPGVDVRHVHHTENAYEYPGIRKVWELGKENTQALILYFHARGISRIKLGKFRRNRQFTERGLFKKVIGEWRENLTWLKYIQSAEKLGINCGGNGWLWFNFWWVRASYVAHLEEPVKTDRRHYYEDWIARDISNGSAGGYPNSLDKCLSIASSPGLKKFNLGSDFHPLKGETNLGLPLGRLRYHIARIAARLKRALGRKI